MRKTLIGIAVITVFIIGLSQTLKDRPTKVTTLVDRLPSVETELKSDPIDIGVFEPLSGINQEGGQSELEGILLANELYPLVNGHKIILHLADNESDRYKTIDAVMSLIEGKKVKALIGSWGSSFALAAGPIINEERVPTVGASCTNPKITIGNRYYSRVSYIDTFQGTALAKFAYKNLSAKTAAILMEEANDYSTDLGEYFTNAFAELNNYKQSILMEDYYRTGQTDYSQLLHKVKLLQPDIIFIPGNQQDVASIIQQAQELGIQSKFIGTDTLDTAAFAENMKKLSSEVYYSTFYSHEFSKTEESKKFLLAYRNKYGKYPNAFSALGYDAYLLIYDALRRAPQLDSESINEAIHQAQNVEGATGRITMDQNGDTKRGVVIKRVQGDKVGYITSIEPSN